MSPPPAFTAADVPEVSVIMVTYNAWEWTQRALVALAETTEMPYELIVVDNASTDNTRVHLDEIVGARVLKNAMNCHFGAAANLGAMVARAPRLLFLNSDAIAQPGLLEPLREILDAEDDVAAVTPRLLHVDGRLQEAGSLLWGDAAGDNYGDYDDPARPEYRFRRDVDYASAACLLVRRSAFSDVGGFDPAFHPSYYEDTDLAMRWRARGMRVVYQPRSTAVHKRWASSGGRPGMLDLLLRNRARFLQRWGHTLEGRPPRPAEVDPASLLAMRDVDCGERLLVVASSVDHQVDPTATVLGRALVPPNWLVTLLSLATGTADASAEVLRARGVEVVSGTEHVDRWLATRRHHYTTVAAPTSLPDRIIHALLDTQPTALPVAIVDGEHASQTDPWLAVSVLVICVDPEAQSMVEQMIPSADVVSRPSRDLLGIVTALNMRWGW